MSRFNNIKVDFMSGIVEVGAWDQVYATLEPTGVNVIGVYPPLVLQGQHLEVSVSTFLGLCIHAETALSAPGRCLWALDKSATLSVALEPVNKGLLYGGTSAYPLDCSHVHTSSSL
jgi:hypothetical protein